MTESISNSNAIQTQSSRQFPVRRSGDSERMSTTSSSPSDTLFYDFSGMGKLAPYDDIGQNASSSMAPVPVKCVEIDGRLACP